MKRLENELSAHERTYEYQDTLMTAFSIAGHHEKARAAALKLRDMFEQIGVLQAPNANFGTKGSFAWTIALSQYLDADQKESLAHAQDVIAPQRKP